ncbi:MAG: alanine--tRNA ligase [Desulfomonilaceae bacterium]|nr:alanine--tRNA ligase [Desulfomonilaceae bacterium]
MTGAELREKFLKYFEARGHTRVGSSSLIPEGDPTLLFVNAGMVPFKGVFTGSETRPYTRAVTAQKCLRVSGKHNDLENVGHTARHHTFFEMLGNFSFGDYFKEDAIAFGWEFLTDVVGLPKKQLHVTIFTDDDEADRIWKKVLGAGSNPVMRLGEKDNFWSMGDTGPCGPCSEIHIDLGEQVGCGRNDCAPGCDCDRFLELWNLVFMQFDRDSSGNMVPLPRPSIDTGLGLERLAAVVQGGTSNWESDLFKPLIHHVEELSGKQCSGSDRESIAMRVIADHGRAAAFLIADGVLPSNEGRGYVLRRILRRALRYGKFIGLHEPFLFDCARVVVDRMESAYPELGTHRVLVEKVILHEEERFLETLARGLVLYEEESSRILSDGGRVLPGSVAFRLYDTYGFPLDLTTDLARESGLDVDQTGFNSEMERQRTMARQSWEGIQGEQAGVLSQLVTEGVGTEFTGYETLEDTGLVTAIIQEGNREQEAGAGERVEIITDRTPFYGESGGQVGDRGIIWSNGSEIRVEDALKPLPDLIVHVGTVTRGSFHVGDKVELRVDDAGRRATMANHSATHLLQWALREVLGDHVQQRGSLVDSRHLRFDFTHFSQISRDELDRVEDLVNEKILANHEIVPSLMSLEEARNRGAIALFGEKYGGTVRMVSIGGFSKELCGGTHAKRTGDIGLFKILEERGIASGVRRIEAVTATGALNYVRSLERELAGVSDRIRGSRGEILHKLDKLIEEKKLREREVENLKAKLAQGVAVDILEGVRDVDGVRLLARVVENVSTPKDLRDYADRVRDRLVSGVALLGARSDGKALLIAVVTKDLTNRFHAGKIVKKAAEVVGGSGGGRPDMAQAGGPDEARLESALETVQDFFRTES